MVLLLNGKPLGPPAPSSAASQYTATFNGITFAPGNLTAVGTRNGSACARKTLLTAGRVASLKLEADRSSLYHHRNDLAFVTVTAFDSEGVAVPDADNRVEFTLSPSNLMEISAVGSGDPRDVSSLTNSSSRKRFSLAGMRGREYHATTTITGIRPMSAVDSTVFRST